MFGIQNNYIQQPYQHNQYESQNNTTYQDIPNNVELIQQMNTQQQQQYMGENYVQPIHQQRIMIEEEESENAIQPEGDQQFMQQQQSLKCLSQNYLDLSTAKLSQQQISQNQFNSTTNTSYCNMSYKSLEESKNSSQTLKGNAKKSTDSVSGKQLKNAQNLIFQQAQNTFILPQEKQEEYTDEEESEERKGEKKLSPPKSYKKTIQKEKKAAFTINNVKQNSSCQLSHHSTSQSNTNTSSSSLSRDTFTSSSSSSTLQNQNEEGQNENTQNSAEFNFSLVPLTKNIQQRQSLAGFGDCHVELSIERDSTADNRFISFQYWRPCQQYTIDQTTQIARFFCEPNFGSRTNDFSSCIQVYKNYPEQNINRWGHVLDMYQQWTSILYNEADYFYKKLNANPILKKYFEEKMEIFMNEALKRVNSYLLEDQGNSKNKLFSYSLRKLNEEYKDIGSIQYGYSRGLIDILGPDPNETRLYLQRYGLNYFFDQKTRIERYIHDFQYIQQGGQIYDRVNIVTLDKIEIELKVSNQYIYYDFFQDPAAKEVFGDFSECARLVRKFAGCKMEIFELDPIQQQKLQVERHIYKPIYEKEKYLTFDAQLLSLYYKNEVKKFSNPKGKKPAHKFSSDDEDIAEENQNQNQTNNEGNFEEFGYNPFDNVISFEQKEEDHFQNFQFDTYNYQNQTQDQQ